MTYFWLGVLLLTIIATITMAWGAVSAAPYVPTFGRDVDRFLRLAQLQPHQKFYDLGAGDGKIILAAARRHQAVAVGFEISLLPWLVGWLRTKASRAKPAPRMIWRDFFRENLASADVVTCFLTPRAMAKLGPKFRQELRPGTMVLSEAFAIPGWTPVQIDQPTPKSIKIYVYRLPAAPLGV